MNTCDKQYSKIIEIKNTSARTLKFACYSASFYPAIRLMAVSWTNELIYIGLYIFHLIPGDREISRNRLLNIFFSGNAHLFVGTLKKKQEEYIRKDNRDQELLNEQNIIRIRDV